MPASSLADFRPEHLGPQRRTGRAAGFMLTAAAHLVLLATFLFGVRVAAPAILYPKPLAVRIEKQARMPPPVLNMIPRMVSAQAIYVPAPEFAVVPAPVRAPVAPAPTAAAPAIIAPPLGTADPAYMTLVRQFLQKELDEQHPQGGYGALGTVEMVFTLNRVGHVLYFGILKSSGRASVDNTAPDDSVGTGGGR